MRVKVRPATATDADEAENVAAIELHATSIAEPLHRSMGFDDTGPGALRRRPG